MSVNKAILIGNLGKDPEVRYAADGAAVANVSIATQERWTDKNSGDKQERTEWHRVVFFGKLAEIVAKYLKKGSQCYIEGRIQTRKWTDKEGADRYTTEILADRMEMVGGRPQGGQQDQPQQPQQGQTQQRKPAEDHTGLDDDIPF